MHDEGLEGADNLNLCTEHRESHICRALLIAARRRRDQPQKLVRALQYAVDGSYIDDLMFHM